MDIYIYIYIHVYIWTCRIEDIYYWVVDRGNLSGPGCLHRGSPASQERGYNTPSLDRPESLA